jgi:valyl-tRNA synthetase
MLGDTAVAVNPADERYRPVVGRNVVLPLLERVIPVVADEFVDPQFGTGAVKVTPAHDANDFEIALRHNLPRVEVIDEEARMSGPALTAGSTATRLATRWCRTCASAGCWRKSKTTR